MSPIFITKVPSILNLMLDLQEQRQRFGDVIIEPPVRKASTNAVGIS